MDSYPRSRFCLEIDSYLESYVSEQSINSDVVIACIDAFFPAVDKPIVVVMDKAPIHTS